MNSINLNWAFKVSTEFYDLKIWITGKLQPKNSATYDFCQPEFYKLLG